MKMARFALTPMLRYALPRRGCEIWMPTFEKKIRHFLSLYNHDEHAIIYFIFIFIYFVQ